MVSTEAIKEKPISPEDFPQASENLKGRELAALALSVGEEVFPHLSEAQKRYLEAKSRRIGVEWPKGFFQLAIEEVTK